MNKKSLLIALSLIATASFADNAPSTNLTIATKSGIIDLGKSDGLHAPVTFATITLIPDILLDL